MKNKLLLIVNPNAGRGGYKINFGDALQVLDTAGYEVTVRFTAGRGDGTAIAAQNSASYDTVACIGGDGTLSEVIAGLMQLEESKRPPLGYFPMGTANDVATTLGLPKNDTVGAAKILASGTAHPYDVGGFGPDKYFAYIAAFGAFTEVSYATPQDLKKSLGHLAYVLQGVAELPKIEKYRVHIEYDDGELDEELVYGSMSNSTSVAGIVHLKEEMVCLGDGMSELVLVRDPGSPLAFNDLITSILTRSFDSDALIILHTRKAKFTFDRPVTWTTDGEAGGAFEQIELCNYPCPIRLIF